MDFIAQILAKLDARQAEADLKSITDKKYQIDVELNLTNKSLDVNKILSGLESSFKTSGQNIGKSFNTGLQSGMSTSKFDGHTYIKNYLDGLKRDQKEAESVAKEFTVSQNNALKAVKSKNTASAKYDSQIKKEIESQKKQLDRYQQYQSRLSDLKRKDISNFPNTSGYAQIKKNLQDIETLQSKVNAEMSKSYDTNFDSVNSDLKEMNSLLNKTERLYSNLSKPIGALDATIASNKTLNWLKENSKASKELGDAFEVLAKKQKTATTSGELESYNKEFNSLVNTAKQKGLTGKSWLDEGKRAFTQIAEFTGMYGLAQNLMQDLPREMVNNVIQLDDSLIELQKVSDLAGTSLDNFVKKAYDASSEVARTGREVIDATTTFKKAGYTLDESFNLSKTAMVMMNVGDGIDSVDEASSALIATLKGFQLSDSSAMDVVSMINETSNTSAIDFDNITEGLRRVSGTLNQAGTSIQQTIGLITGGFSQLRNIETVSNGLITISQRLRGISSDGEDLDPKLGEKFASIGVQIENADGSLRSTYEILQDYAKVYNSLTDKEQQYYAELAAGKPNVKTFNAIVQQWADVESATNAAMNSQGSAEAENEKVLQGISSRIAAFKSAFEQLSQTTVNSDFLKGIVDAGTTILKVIDTIIDKFGILQTVIGGFAVGKGITSFVESFDKPACIAS